jgi:hypothetical protein
MVETEETTRHNGDRIFLVVNVGRVLMAIDIVCKSLIANLHTVNIQISDSGLNSLLVACRM